MANQTLDLVGKVVGGRKILAHTVDLVITEDYGTPGRYVTHRIVHDSSCPRPYLVHGHYGLRLEEAQEQLKSGRARFR